MPILAISITTIECDGHYGAICPNKSFVEYEHPQSVAIRLAQQSGWTVSLETMCPECSAVSVPVTATAPPAPANLAFGLLRSPVGQAGTRSTGMVQHRLYVGV